MLHSNSSQWEVLASFQPWAWASSAGVWGVASRSSAPDSSASTRASACTWAAARSHSGCRA